MVENLTIETPIGFIRTLFINYVLLNLVLFKNIMFVHN